MQFSSDRSLTSWFCVNYSAFSFVLLCSSPGLCPLLHGNHGVSVNKRGNSVGWRREEGKLQRKGLTQTRHTAALPWRHPASLRPSINKGWQVSDDSRSTVGSYKDRLWVDVNSGAFWNSQIWGPWRKPSASPAPNAVSLWDSQANNYAGNTLFLPLGCSWLPLNWNLLVRLGPPWWSS